MVRMFRTGFCAAALPVVFLFFAFVSCADESRNPVSDGSRKLDRELGKSSEVQELFAIRDEIAARALARHVTGEDIRAAGCDAGRMNELLGFSETESRARLARIRTLIRILYERFPSLGRLEGTECAGREPCDAETVAAGWERSSKALAAALGADTGAPRAPAKAPLKCNMQKIIMGFSACATRSGGSLLTYALCAYGVFCGSCSGGLADIICG
jgi:hypothetical protein